MNVGFAGTPAFAATVLASLLDAGFDVPLVLTQPDRPQGRGLRHEPSPVKRLAIERGIEVRQPGSLAGEAAREMLVAAEVDVLAVAAYGLLLPESILNTPPEGCINVYSTAEYNAQLDSAQALLPQANEAAERKGFVYWRAGLVTH